MISVEDLVDILNREITKDFLEAAMDLFNDGDFPIDPEHPEMEQALENIADEINDRSESLPIKDDYDE